VTVSALGANRTFAVSDTREHVISEYGRAIAFFHFEGSDEGDENHGAGSAEYIDDGTVEIEFSLFYGDAVVLLARKT